MIAFLLQAALQTSPAPVSPQSPETLHPPGAVVYLAIPDVQRSLRAYEKAPVVRLARDEEVGASVRGIFEDLDISAGGSLAAAARELGLPESIARDPLGALAPWAEKLECLSVSFSVGDDLPAEDIARQLEAFRRMRSLSLRIEAHRALHGEPPSELGELDAGELATDPWGAAFVYTLDAESGEHELRSLGAGGRPGGAGVQRDLTSAEAADLLGWAKRNGHLLALAHLRDEDSARMAGEWVGSELGKLGVATERHERLFAGERSFQVLLDGGELGVQGWILQSGKLLALGTGSLDALAARVEGRATSLATGPRLGALRQKLSSGEGAVVLDAFVDAESLQRILDVFAPPYGGPLEGLWGALAVRSRLHEGRFTTEIATSGLQGRSPLSALGATELPQGMWRLLPEDAIGFLAASLDGPMLFDELLALGGSDGSFFDELEDRYGFSVERDLFGSLGGGALVYLLPVTALIAPPGCALVLEVRDEQAFRRGLDGLFELLNELLEANGGSIKMRPYQEVPLWTLSLPQSMRGSLGPMQPSPSVALARGHAIFTLTSLRAKKEIKRALGEEGSLHALLSSERKPPADAVLAGYLDWPALLSGIYGGGRSLLSLAGTMGGQDLPVDVQSLPAAEVFVRYFEPTTVWTRKSGAGSLTRIDGSFGLETGPGLALLAFALVAGGSMREEVVVSQTLELEPPAAGEAAATRATMDYLRTRLAVYRIENGKYPAALGVLIESTHAYPKGYLKEQVLPDDAWGRPFRYGADPDGATFRLWSVGPDGVDQQGGGDDVQG